MSVNTLNFEQVSTVLTSIVQQATGQIVETPTDTASFVSVAQVALRADRDSVMNAISNILARTIFSIRPYSAKMTGLDMDTFRWAVAAISGGEANDRSSFDASPSTIARQSPLNRRMRFDENAVRSVGSPLQTALSVAPSRVENVSSSRAVGQNLPFASTAFAATK